MTVAALAPFEVSGCRNGAATSTAAYGHRRLLQDRDEVGHRQRGHLDIAREFRGAWRRIAE
jgi:hypothetical protein